jgi:hypothetical protein
VTPDHGLRRLLEGLPREAAPPIPVEALLRRLLWRRLRTAGLVLGLLAAPLVAHLLLREEAPPPVHLRLRVLDLGEPIAEPSEGPPEINLP